MLMTGSGRAARVQYLPGTLRLLSDGDHVDLRRHRRPHPARRASILER